LKEGGEDGGLREGDGEGEVDGEGVKEEIIELGL
jgi:hypothetical protein